MMKNKKMQQRLSDEILEFMESKKTLQLSSLTVDGHPYASYAPFSVGDKGLYIMISDIAIHAINLAHNSKAAALIIEDESEAENIFARLRIAYSMNAELIDRDTPQWQKGVCSLSERHGQHIDNVSQLQDFKLFLLKPLTGRFVKGFGKAYSWEGGLIDGQEIQHLRGGHQKISA